MWYHGIMSGSHTTVMGDRGRLVVPSDLRARAGLLPGTPLTLIESPDGIVLLTREQLKRMVRRDLAGVDLVADLVADRRRAAADEDASRA
jgi:bifunctional DNA-binding transcriptional regulator/antitoxin component of YhaV-PrlF toxin-antitoxin module